MTNQNIISDIQEHLIQLSPEKLQVVWQLVKLLDSGQPQASPMLAHDWFDAEEFLRWRQTQRDIDLALESERDSRQSVLWNQ